MPVANWLNWQDTGPPRTWLCYRPAPDEILNNSNFFMLQASLCFSQDLPRRMRWGWVLSMASARVPWCAESPPLAHKMALRWRDIGCDWRETRRRLINHPLASCLIVNSLKWPRPFALFRFHGMSSLLRSRPTTRCPPIAMAGGSAGSPKFCNQACTEFMPPI